MENVFDRHTKEKTGQKYLLLIVNGHPSRIDRHTKEKTGQRYPLLLVDGHHSRINPSFMKYLENHHIIMLVLPLYAIYRLQSLDIILFLPFSKVYSKELLDFMMKDQGFVRTIITKRMFYSFF